MDANNHLHDNQAHSLPAAIRCDDDQHDTLIYGNVLYKNHGFSAGIASKGTGERTNLRRPSTAAPDLPDNEVMDGARTDMCIEDLKRLGNSSQPFMLAMGYIRPHLAFVAPKKYWDMYDPEKLPVPEDQQTPIGALLYSMHNNSELNCTTHNESEVGNSQPDNLKQCRPTR